MSERDDTNYRPPQNCRHTGNLYTREIPTAQTQGSLFSSYKPLSCATHSKTSDNTYRQPQNSQTGHLFTGHLPGRQMTLVEILYN